MYSGSYGHNEVWSFGDQAFNAISSVMHIREGLRTYVAENLALASAEGTPLLRPIAFDFAGADAIRATDQYLFGPRFLVAPVLKLFAKQRLVYFPPLSTNKSWVNYYTGEKMSSGWKNVSLSANVSEFPLYESQG